MPIAAKIPKLSVSVVAIDTAADMNTADTVIVVTTTTAVYPMTVAMEAIATTTFDRNKSISTEREKP
jgi:hypothetical protein